MKNPFAYTGHVHGRNFCPRPELKSVLNRLDSGDSLALIGPRRTGKTSLIFEAARRAKKKVAYVDFLSVREEQDIANRLLSGLDGIVSWKQKAFDVFSSLGVSMTIDQLTGNPSFSLDSRGRKDPQTIDRILGSIVRLLKSHPNVILALDEFQVIKENPKGNELLALFRSKLQFVDQSVVYSGSVRHELDWVFNDYDSPYFKSVIVVDVPPIVRKSLQPFLNRRFAKSSISLTDEAWDFIWDVTDGFPGDIQHLCAAIFELGKDGELDIQEARDALSVVLAEPNSNHNDRFDLLPHTQSRVIVAIANFGGNEIGTENWMSKGGFTNHSSVIKAANALVSKNILWKDGSGYRFYDPFFRAWLLSRFPRII